jgi:hypothetical protein
MPKIKPNCKIFAEIPRWILIYEKFKRIQSSQREIRHNKNQTKLQNLKTHMQIATYKNTSPQTKKSKIDAHTKSFF